MREAAAPRAKPIAFSPPMIRAERAGLKTQTRRHAKAALLEDGTEYVDDDGWPFHFDEGTGCDIRAGCPYGVPGDLLWVKEAHYLFGEWLPINSEHTRWSFSIDRSRGALFDAPDVVQTVRGTKPGWWKRTGMFMPRWASRTLLEVIEVRVQRLQDISEADAIAEGVVEVTPKPVGIAHWSADTSIGTATNPVLAYRQLWEHINGAGSWDLNPHVWAVSFRRVP